MPNIQIHAARLCGILSAMQWQCPICRRPTDSDMEADFPFCSERCKLLDLGAWASEKYVVSEPVIDESAPESSAQDTHDREN